jgi:hypothetical protein
MVGAAIAVMLGVATAAAQPAPAPPAAPAPTAAAAPTSLAMRARPAPHAGIADDMDCSACHTTTGWQLSATAGGGAGGGGRGGGFDHDRTGFPLRGAHVQNRCTDCHTGGGRPRSTCDGCHRDPHQGRNDRSCAECHTATAWSDTAALDEHRRTRMPLTGRHALLDCTECHRRSGERAFSDAPSDCYACHRDDYHASDIHPVHNGAGGAAPFSRECSLCHRTSGWTPAIVSPDLRARSAARDVPRIADHDARFALRSAGHRSAACTACHPDPRRTQLVRCDGCHDAVALRQQHRSPVARSPSACLGCHPRGASRGRLR